MLQLVILGEQISAATRLNMQQMEITSWGTFKSLIATKGLLIQYTQAINTYEIYGPEASSFMWHYSMLMDNGSDQTDFETNFKANANQPLEYRSIDGLVKVADARFVDNLSFYVDGSQGSLVAPASQTTYVKYNFSYSYTLAGMDLYWYGANWGDYMECEVGIYLNPSDESTFQVLSVFSNQYKIYQIGFRIFDVTTVKTIPPSITMNGVTFPVVVRCSYVNVGPNDAKAILNLVGWK